MTLAIRPALAVAALSIGAIWLNRIVAEGPLLTSGQAAIVLASIAFGVMLIGALGGLLLMGDS